MTNNYRNTVRDLVPAVGAKVTVRFEKLAIVCTVLDAKNSYGQVRLLVEPVAGAGEQWIELGRLVAAPAGAASAAFSLEAR